MTSAVHTVSTKSSLASVFTCRSRLAALARGRAELHAARVSRPVYTTTPVAAPDASTLFAHSVFSRLSGS